MVSRDVELTKKGANTVQNHETYDRTDRVFREGISAIRRRAAPIESLTVLTHSKDWRLRDVIVLQPNRYSFWWYVVHVTSGSVLYFKNDDSLEGDEHSSDHRHKPFIPSSVLDQLDPDVSAGSHSDDGES